MSQFPNCPQCDSDLTYTDGNAYICPMCGHEWTQAEMEAAAEAARIRDINGNELQDGDSVIVVQDLKLSATQVIKQGTKVKSIRLLSNPVDGHDIACRLPELGQIYLKSEFVKKS